MKSLKTIIILAVLVVFAAGFPGQVLSMGSHPPPPSPDFTFEPPVNPYLADSPWPMTHRNPYCQASSPYPGPTEAGRQADKDFNIGFPGLITMAISNEYADGGRVIWGSSSTDVFKATPDLGYIDAMKKENLTVNSLMDTDEILSGAYTLVDINNEFYMPRFTKIFAFGDAVAGDRFSDVEIRREYEIPAGQLSHENEKIVGLNLTYDGMLAFATSHGLVGVVSRSFDTAHYYRFGPDDEVSNSIACDEDGGIYVVTSERMYRVQWTGAELTTDPAKGGWAAQYETGEPGGVRLGAGSGATPTLMGTDGQERFVVVTDGQQLMHLVLFWRGDLPQGWQQIEGTKDKRIAAQVPVTFGDANAEQTLSEQSVCVRGYGALVVNNQLAAQLDMQIINIILSGVTFNAPYGAEKFVWDPANRVLETAWVNNTVSMPNGIPCMSAATNLVYDVGQDWLGGWTFEALDWDTGKSVFSFRYGTGPAYNSAYAGTQVGLDACLYSGTALGMVRMVP